MKLRHFSRKISSLMGSLFKGSKPFDKEKVLPFLNIMNIMHINVKIE